MRLHALSEPAGQYRHPSKHHEVVLCIKFRLRTTRFDHLESEGLLKLLRNGCRTAVKTQETSTQREHVPPAIEKKLYDRRLLATGRRMPSSDRATPAQHQQGLWIHKQTQILMTFLPALRLRRVEPRRANWFMDLDEPIRLCAWKTTWHEQQADSCMLSVKRMTLS